MATQRETGAVLFVEVCDAGVEVPAEIVEARRGGQGTYFGERFLLHVLETDDNIGDLHACVVYVILHFDTAPRTAQQTNQRVA